MVGEFTPVGTSYDTIEPQVEGMTFVGEPPTENGTALGELGVAGLRGQGPLPGRLPRGLQGAAARQRAHRRGQGRARRGAEVELVASVEGGYTQDTGLKAAQNVLQAHPDVNVMIGSSQAIAGAEQAVEDAGGDVALVGNGGSRQAVDGRQGGPLVRDLRDRREVGRREGRRAGDRKAARRGGAARASTRATLQEPRGTKEALGDVRGPVRRVTAARSLVEVGRRPSASAACRRVRRRQRRRSRAAPSTAWSARTAPGKSTLAKIIGGVHQPDAGRAAGRRRARALPLAARRARGRHRHDRPGDRARAGTQRARERVPRASSRGGSASSTARALRRRFARARRAHRLRPRPATSASARCAPPTSRRSRSCARSRATRG